MLRITMATATTFRGAVFWALVVLSGLVIALPALWWLLPVVLAGWFGVDVHVH